ncbi:hypothetical protein [Dyadobacter bucti]|uniref:hypothetical protein n=1 Tax=Dyadobacter bucti TaxID=2572203 RepID=UPI003F72B3A0
MKKYYLILFLIVFQSCGGISNTSEELGSGFVYSNMGLSFKIIYNPNPDQHDILGKVISYCFSDDFIIVAQVPDKEVHRLVIANDLETNLKRKSIQLTQNNINQLDGVADSLIVNDPYYQKIFSQKLNYWIISHKSKKMYGPLSEIEYLKKRKELRVPEELQLDED